LGCRPKSAGATESAVATGEAKTSDTRRIPCLGPHKPSAAEHETDHPGRPLNTSRPASPGAGSRPRPATQHQKPRGGNTMASRLLIRTDSQLSLPIPAAWDHGKTPLHTVSGQGSSRELTEKPPPMRRNPSQHGRRHLPRQAGKAVRLRAGCHGPARHGAGAACAFGHLPGFHADHHRTSGSRLSQRPGRTKTKKQITVRRAPTGPCRCRSCGPSGRGHC